MKGTILALALLCAGAVCAQTPPPAAAVAAHMDKLATLLDLTDDQKAQVQTILQEEHAKVRASIEQAKASGTMPDWQKMQGLHQQIQQETLQKLTPVLSATQLKKFQIIQETMHQHMGHMGPGGPGAPATPPAQN